MTEPLDDRIRKSLAALMAAAPEPPPPNPQHCELLRAPPHARVACRLHHGLVQN